MDYLIDVIYRLVNYNKKINNIEFEKLHPFYDGNGRVGRFIIILLCIQFKIPFIIIDKNNQKIISKLFNDYNLDDWKNINILINEITDFFKYLVTFERHLFK